MRQRRTRAGAGISTDRDSRQAGANAATAARLGLAGERADLAFVFASGEHLANPAALLEGVHSALGPRNLIGCGAGGVLAQGEEHEAGTAVAVWAARFGNGGEVSPFRAVTSSDPHAVEAIDVGLDGLELDLDDLLRIELPMDLRGADGAILLADPYSFPTDAALEQLSKLAPALPVLGGVASARTPAGMAALFLGEEVCEQGAVGVRLEGVEMLPCVSQGAAPLGREVTITSAEGNLIFELAGRPALETVERLVADLSPRERVLIAAGLLLGIVIDSGKPDFGQGDFLVRGLLGVDRSSGALAVGAPVRAGQIVRLHARDARSAGEDLRGALRLRREALADHQTAGALLFSCNGRGRAMFNAPDHDVATVQRELHGAPCAGFFAAGEIGPVAGRSFLHAFTATIAVFPD